MAGSGARFGAGDHREPAHLARSEAPAVALEHATTHSDGNGRSTGDPFAGRRRWLEPRRRRTAAEQAQTLGGTPAHAGATALLRRPEQNRAARHRSRAGLRLLRLVQGGPGSRLMLSRAPRVARARGAGSHFRLARCFRRSGARGVARRPGAGRQAAGAEQFAAQRTRNEPARTPGNHAPGDDRPLFLPDSRAGAQRRRAAPPRGRIPLCPRPAF
jgi:hypothetical protein